MNLCARAVLFVIGATSSAGVCTSASMAAAAQDTPPAAINAYVLGPGDLIEVSVFGQPEFTTRAKVRADGSIALPFLNTISVEGQSTVSLAISVGQKLRSGGYYARPVVAVEVAGYASRYVIALGEVGVPGIIPIDRPYRVSEIIARSGGLRESGADYVIIRHDGSPERKLPYDKLGRGGDADDPYVAPNDKIFVPPAPTFSIYGQIAAAGNYPIKGVFTLRKAIARAGGLRDIGTEKHAKVYRNGVRSRMGLDDEVQNGDIINIAERLF